MVIERPVAALLGASCQRRFFARDALDMRDSFNCSPMNWRASNSSPPRRICWTSLGFRENHQMT
eukprot:1480470-Pyramimonas_sp.AAC.1